jgi:signal peptide peptidase SppA
MTMENNFWYMDESSLVASLLEKQKATSGVNAFALSDMFNARQDMQVTPDGVAIVKIGGSLLNKFSKLDTMVGNTSYAQIQNEIAQAADDPAVKAILLDIDSPGGAVTGTAETASVVKMAKKKKPVVSYTGNMAGSAAYWIGSAADVFYATPSALVGSIGVIAKVMDMSGLLEKAGIRVETFTPEYADLKGAGMGNAPMTREQRKWYQGFVEELGAAFKASVIEHRGPVDDGAMRGQMFTGSGAKEANLVDEVADYSTAYADALALAYTRAILREVERAS